MVSPSFDFEKSLLPSDCRYLLGLDEVGRGPLAGPVTVGAFLLDLSAFDPQVFINLGVRDSKLLTPQKRQTINHHLQNHHYSLFSASSQQIDNQGIAVILKNLFTKALKFYRSYTPLCLIDGNYNLDFPDTKFVIKGDSHCFSIAAASIVAKVHRDKLMDDYHQQYPMYGFDKNKGYGTKKHYQALIDHGPCLIHRFSYSPIKNFKLKIKN